MVAMRMLRARAVGFITSGATPTSAIAARYPDAPACPTDEYRIAAAKIKRASKTTCSIATHPTLSPYLPRREGVLGSWRILREFIAGCYRGGATGGPAPQLLRHDSNEHLWNFGPARTATRSCTGSRTPRAPRRGNRHIEKYVAMLAPFGIGEVGRAAFVAHAWHGREHA